MRRTFVDEHATAGYRDTIKLDDLAKLPANKGHCLSFSINFLALRAESIWYFSDYTFALQFLGSPSLPLMDTKG